MDTYSSAGRQVGCCIVLGTERRYIRCSKEVVGTDSIHYNKTRQVGSDDDIYHGSEWLFHARIISKYIDNNISKSVGWPFVGKERERMEWNGSRKTRDACSS